MKVKLIAALRRMWGPLGGLLNPPLLREVSWGKDFPNRHFLVVRRNEPQAGLFSHFITNLGWIRYAKEHGYECVIDMMTTRNVYLRRAERGVHNAWEDFFQQPSGISLAQIRHAARVTIATGVPNWQGFLPSMGSAFLRGEDGGLEVWRKLTEETIKVNESALSPLQNAAFEQALEAGVVGVLARGTDYVALRPTGHPVQPTAEELIKRVKRFEPPFVYLVTEDSAIERSFRACFGERLITANQPHMDYSGGYLSDSSQVKGNRARALAYLRAVYDLSRCPRIVAGRTSGTVAAALLSRGFVAADYVDLGIYS